MKEQQSIPGGRQDVRNLRPALEHFEGIEKMGDVVGKAPLLTLYADGMNSGVRRSIDQYGP